MFRLICNNKCKQSRVCLHHQVLLTLCCCVLGVLQAAQAAPKPQADAVKPKPVKQAVADAPRRITRSQTRAMTQGASSDAQETRAAGPANKRRSGSQAPASQQLQQSQPQQHTQQQPQQQQQQSAVQQLPPLPDIDGPDKYNHLAECQYVNDIYGYFRHIEPKYRAPANYMDSQVGGMLCS